MYGELGYFTKVSKEILLLLIHLVAKQSQLRLLGQLQICMKEALVIG
ncbi:hypothetical protein V7659_28060 [Neobacillus drentensis]